MVDLEQSLSRAKEWHTNEPFDAGHDWEHHSEVIDNCRRLIHEENLEEKVNIAIVLVAAAWHDFRRGRDDYSVLRDELVKQGASEDFVDRVEEVISSHSFGEVQNTLESKILFDADKLAYLSIERIKKVKDAVDRGEMKRETLSRYGHHFRQRIPQLPELLHFDSTKRRFTKLLNDYRSFIETEPELYEFKV